MDTPADDPLVGRLLDGRYLVGTKIARGGMATVYEATDLRLDRLVALKVMPQTLADDDTFRQRFVREARSAARLTHPNVVGVYDQGDDRGTLFLAMEYVAGRHTLRDVIREEAPLPPRRALTVLEAIVTAIAAAHEAGIVHCDIKPENVLIDPRGVVKVADFGLARAISAATAATATGGVLMGTVSYLPPELVLDGSADARSDVYALGVLLYELLTGVKPHVGDSPIQVAYKHVHEDVPAPSTVVPGIPPYLDALVARATSRERDLRPADAHVLLQQLRRVRHALDHGVLDDEELTDDLSPTLAIRRLQPAPVAAAPAGSGYRDPRDEVFDVTRDDGDDRDAAAESTMVVGVPRPDDAVEPPGPGPGATAAPLPGRPGRRGRRRGWIAFVLVLLLAAGAAYSGWWYGVGRFEPTPDVLHMSQPAAEAAMRRVGLTLDVAEVAYSETVDRGDVISTDPEPGDKVLSDGTVSAVVSRGPERHTMPDLAGVSESHAITEIHARSLKVGETHRVYSDDVRTGDVVRFRPKAGSSLPPGTPVTLVVSKGPKPVRIDDLAGRPADTVDDRLTALGLDVKRHAVYDDRVDEGVVISSRPSHGRLYPGDTLRLVVSLGPHLVEVQDVYGFGVDDATQALQDAGFVVHTVEADAYFGLGFVVGQSVSGGDTAPYGSVIVLTLV